MLTALLAVAVTHDHAAIGKQAADAVDAAQRVEEEGVPAGADDALMEADAALVQGVGRIGVERPVQEPKLGRAQPLDGGWLELDILARAGLPARAPSAPGRSAAALPA